MATDLQWKIEDGLWEKKVLVVNDGDGWVNASHYDAALILEKVVLATQEKCAQVAEAEERDAADQEAADDARGYSANVHVQRGRMKSAASIASAIRSLKMETGHE